MGIMTHSKCVSTERSSLAGLTIHAYIPALADWRYHPGTISWINCNGLRMERYSVMEMVPSPWWVLHVWRHAHCMSFQQSQITFRNFFPMTWWVHQDSHPDWTLKIDIPHRGAQMSGWGSPENLKRQSFKCKLDLWIILFSSVKNSTCRSQK